MPTARSEILYFLRSTVFVPESESATEFVSDRKKIRMTNNIICACTESRHFLDVQFFRHSLKYLPAEPAFHSRDANNTNTNNTNNR